MRVAAAVLLGIATVACAPREWLLPKVGIDPPALREFPPDYTPPISAETNRPMPGFGGTGGGVHRTPLILIHGNTVSARYWLPARDHLLKAGYTTDEVWALGYGWDNVRYLDSVDTSVPSIERMVTSIMEYLSKKTGRTIHQVDLVGHSMGACSAMQWLRQTNGFHKVRNFIGAASCLHGTWTAWPEPRGPSRNVSYEFFPGSPWLRQLHHGGEIPGAVRYMTVYDGTGWADVFFPHPMQHAPALEGAHNVAYNVKHGTWLDHLQLGREPGPVEEMLAFIKQAPEPLPQAEPPRLVRDGDVLRAEPRGATVHCATGGQYPTHRTPGVANVKVGELTLYTCYARDRKSELVSPIGRYQAGRGPKKTEPLTLRADQPGGVLEHPVSVTLTASDPAAFIVYTTSGGAPESGSPLYVEPIYVPSPLVLHAVAIAPDGRVSETLKLEFNVSLEWVEARHSLQRQFDPDAPVRYAGRRRHGR